MQDKILPHSEASERALIGAMLIDNDIIKHINLKQEDFYNDVYWKIYNMIKYIDNDGKKVDLLILKDILDKKKVLDKLGGMSFLVELVEDTPLSSNYKQYVEHIKELSNRRKIIKLGRQIENIGFNSDDETEKILARVKNMSEHIFEIEDNKGYGIEELYEHFSELYERYNTLGGLGFSSAHKELDKYTQGIIPGTIQTIVAYSNVGKSNFSYSYIPDLLRQGKKVLFLSNEVMADMLISNIIRAYYGITQKELMGDFAGKIDWELFKDLKIYDDIFDLEDIKIIIENSNADVVFIDFIQNIKTTAKTEYEAMSKVAIELQRLAIKTGKTIFSISQANNDSRFSNGDKLQPKGSGAIFASSDVIIGLYKEGEEMKLNIIKNKFGHKDINFLLDVDFARVQFKVVKEIGQETFTS